MKLKALVIAPYEGLRDLVEAVSSNMSNIETDVHLGDMHDGVKIVNALNTENYDVIISRAGTADLIRNYTNLPVIDIKLSILDMMRAIKLAQNYTGKFGVVGYKSITEQAKTIRQLYDFQFDVLTFDAIKNIDKCLSEMKKRGVTLIVGDVITTKHAKMMGFDTILLTSGEETIEAALQEAIELYHTIAKREHDIGLFKRVNEYSDRFIFSYSDSNEVYYTNITKKNPLYSKFQQTLHTLLPNLYESKELEFVKTIDGAGYTITGKLLSYKNKTYPTFYIQRMHRAPNIEKEFIRYNHLAEMPNIQFETFPSRSEKFQAKIASAKQYANTNKSILIFGDQYTGKSRLAKAIYQQSPYTAKPFVEMDVQHMNPSQLEQILTNDESPFLNSNLTIFIKNIHDLSSQNEVLFINYFNNTKVHKRNRFIFSSIRNTTKNKTSLLQYICNEIGAFVLDIPSLNERREDIPGYVSVFLSDLIPKYGKQILGFNEDAMNLLVQYDWQYNLIQLKNVVEALIVHSSDFYIHKETTEKVLQQVQKPKISTHTNTIDTSKTLDEITREVIHTVLKEVDYNQSEAAKRLGVSRSTIWRWLK